MSDITPSTEQELQDQFNQELDRVFQEQYKDAQEQQEPTPPIQSESSSEESPEQGEAKTPAEPTSIELGDGVSISRQRARDLYDLEEYLKANPDIAIRMYQATQGTPTPQSIVKTQPVPGSYAQPIQPDISQQQQEVIPEEIDLDDPSTRLIWNRLQQIEKQTQSSIQSFQQQQQMTTQAQVDEGIKQFQKDRELSDEEVFTLRDQAYRTVNFPALAQSNGGNLVKAAHSAMDTVYWNNPVYREKELQSKRDQQAKQLNDDQKRQRKLSSVAGTSGSVPREVPQNLSKEDRKKAMIQEIAQAMSGPAE